MSVPRLWSRGQEGSLCEQTDLEAVMTASFEDYPLAKAVDKIVTEQGFGCCLTESEELKL